MNDVDKSASVEVQSTKRREEKRKEGEKKKREKRGKKKNDLRYGERSFIGETKRMSSEGPFNGTRILVLLF